MLTISHRFAADCQPYGLDARRLASSSKSAYFMGTIVPTALFAEPSSRVLDTFFSQLIKKKTTLMGGFSFFEREKGLEPSTSTLGRSRSTN